MVSENRIRARFLFDTNVFGKILKIQVSQSLLTDKHECFVTHIQNDELNAAPLKVKNKLLTVFKIFLNNLYLQKQPLLMSQELAWQKSAMGNYTI